MHYLQLSGIVNKLDIELPLIVEIIFSIPIWIGLPVDNLLYIMDCLLVEISDEDGIPIVFMRAIWTLVIPMVYVFCIGAVYMYAILTKKIKHNLNYLYNGLCLLMVFLTPSEANILASVITCRDIGGKLYITADVAYPCYDTVHLKFLGNYFYKFNNTIP